MRQKTGMLYLSLLLSGIVLVACSNSDVAGKGSTTETTNGISARVLLSDGSPAVGALLRVQSSQQEACGSGELPDCGEEAPAVLSALTDTQGRLRLDSLPAGIWRVNVDLGGLGVSKAVARDTLGDDLGNLFLDSLGVLQGWVPGVANSVLVRIPGTELWTRTDEQGNFELPGVYAGEWLVSARIDDEVAYASRALVQGGRSTRVDTWHPRLELDPSQGLMSGWRWDFSPTYPGAWVSPQLVPVSLARGDFSARGGGSPAEDVLFMDGAGRLLSWFLETGDADSLRYWVSALPPMGAPGASVWLGMVDDGVNPTSAYLPRPWPERPWVLAHMALGSEHSAGDGARPQISPMVSADANGLFGDAFSWLGDTCALSYHLDFNPDGQHWSAGGNLGWWMSVADLDPGSPVFTWHDGNQRVIWQAYIRDAFGGIGVRWSAGNGQMDSVASSLRLQVDQWSHIAAVWDSMGRRIMVDGRMAAEIPPLPVDPRAIQVEHLCPAGSASPSSRAGRTRVDQVMLALPDPMRVNWGLLVDLWSTPRVASQF